MLKDALSILLVDDEVDLAEALALFFQMKGFAADIASTKKEALALLEKKTYTAVISDIRLKNESGIDLLCQIKKLYPQGPRVFLITGSLEVSFHDMYEKGAEAIFSKPFSGNEIVDGVVNILNKEETNVPSQRRYFREEIEAEVELKIPQGSIVTQALNVGFKGFFAVLKDVAPQVGDEVSFKIQLGKAEDPLVCGQGYVRWVRYRSEGVLQRGCGVEIHFFEGEGKKLLTEFLNLKRIGSK